LTLPTPHDHVSAVQFAADELYPLDRPFLPLSNLILD